MLTILSSQHWLCINADAWCKLDLSNAVNMNEYDGFLIGFKYLLWKTKKHGTFCETAIVDIFFDIIFQEWRHSSLSPPPPKWFLDNSFFNLCGLPASHKKLKHTIYVNVFFCLHKPSIHSQDSASRSWRWRDPGTPILETAFLLDMRTLNFKHKRPYHL